MQPYHKTLFIHSTTGPLFRDGCATQKGFPSSQDPAHFFSSRAAAREIGQQTRKTFGLAYRTIVGNDLVGNDFGYKLHLIYGATASPSEKNYSTVNDSPEAGSFSFELTTTPIAVQGYKNTASLTIDSTKIVDKTALKTLEDKLFGTDNTEPELPTPAQVFTTLGLTYDTTTGLWS